MERIIEVISIWWWPILKEGLIYSIPLTLITFTLGLILGLIVALIRISNMKILKPIVGTYVWIFRGTPMLVQLFIIFYGLPSVGINLNAFLAAVIGFSLNIGAYTSETIRAAILSIDKGQWDGAYSIGMTKSMVLRRIIIPQAVNVSIPPLSNSFISLVKDTSLASNITITEMFMQTQFAVAKTYEPMILYCLVAAYYLFFCTILTVLQTKLEVVTSKYIRRST